MAPHCRFAALLAYVGALTSISGAAHARPDKMTKVSDVKPNPDVDDKGNRKPQVVSLIIKRKDLPKGVVVDVTIPGDGATAVQKAAAVVKAINAKDELKYGDRPIASANGATVMVKGDADHDLKSIARGCDNSHEKDVFATAGTGARFDVGVRDGFALAASTSTNVWETGEVSAGSSFTVGVEGLNTVRVDLVPGMRLRDVLAAAHTSLVLDPASPQILVDSMTYENEVLSFNFPDGTWDRGWGFVIQSTDLGLRAAEWAEFTSVPAPPTILLPGVGLIALRRRSRA